MHGDGADREQRAPGLEQLIQEGFGVGSDMAEHQLAFQGRFPRSARALGADLGGGQHAEHVVVVDVEFAGVVAFHAVPDGESWNPKVSDRVSAVWSSQRRMFVRTTGIACQVKLSQVQKDDSERTSGPLDSGDQPPITRTPSQQGV